MNLPLIILGRKLHLYNLCVITIVIFVDGFEIKKLLSDFCFCKITHFILCTGLECFAYYALVLKSECRGSDNNASKGRRFDLDQKCCRLFTSMEYCCLVIMPCCLEVPWKNIVFIL